MFEDYLEFLYHRIESDLASFADPGGVNIERNGRSFDAIWEIRGKPSEARFTASQDRGITVTINGESEPYRVFLAGTQMADLRHMAQMIRQTGARDIFVPTRAYLTDTDTLPRPATELLADLLEHQETEVTQVVMVTGEAGAGKTRVLQELVQQQAVRYLNGLTEKLFLYVNAQGRALATELQDLKVNLTYHSIALLGRLTHRFMEHTTASRRSWAARQDNDAPASTPGTEPLAQARQDRQPLRTEPPTGLRNSAMGANHVISEKPRVDQT